MASNRSWAAVLGAALLVAGCSFDTSSLWPSLSADDEEDEVETVQTSTAPPPRQAQAPRAAPPPPQAPFPPPPQGAVPPALGTTAFVPRGVTPGAATGTFVGQKVANQRAELQQVQANIAARNQGLQQIRNQTTQNAQRYHGITAAIAARLQLGTTPGNPVLVSQWNQAQAELDRIGQDIMALNSLANSVAADSAMSAFLLDSIRATYGLQGAVDEDHRQLAILEDETNRTVVLIDRLLSELADDIGRQTTYVGNERRNLTTLALAIKNGELYGASLANRAFGAQSATPSFVTSQAQSSLGSADGLANRQPLVIIRFDRPDVEYEQALYTAVSRTLDRYPQAQFDLVAVTPVSGNIAGTQLAQSRSKQSAERVMRTLTEMGLPANRLSLSAVTTSDAGSNEVRVYVR